MADAEFNPFARPELICCTERYKEISRLRKYYESTQYDGRPDWWTGRKSGETITVPLRERKPCVIYGLPKSATLQVVRFLLGDGRFPSVNVPRKDEPEDESEEGESHPEPSYEPDALERLELDEEDAEQLQTWIGRAIEHSRLKQRLRALARRGVALRTAVAVLSIRDGRYMIDMPSPEDCWAKFKNDDPAAEVTRLVWCYEFDKTVIGPDKKPIQKRFWFRREWDGENHYAWDDVEKQHGKDPVWGVAKATPHGLGFCPVVWIRNSVDSAGSDLDGQSIYDGLFDQFDALNFAYSQRHRGIFYLGVPQPYETGVEEDDGPEATGRKAGPVGFSQGSGDKPPTGAQLPSARRMAPDEMWSYKGDKVNVGLIETTGKAFEVATKHIDDIRSRCCETMGVVLASMSDTTGSRITTGAEMSAKFLAMAHAPLVALVSELRHCWWADGIEPVLSMMLRMCAVLGGKGILIPGSERLAKLLKPFLSVDVVEDQDGEAVTVQTWLCPRLEPLWGRFFEPSALEIQQGVDAANKAVDGDLISRERATQYVADDFGIEDPAREIEAIEAEKAEALASAHDAMGALGQGETEPSAGSPGAAGQGPQANARPGGGNAASASGNGAASAAKPSGNAGPMGVGGHDSGISPGSAG